MQPMLALCAENPGIVYINGHFSGEITREEALLRPIAGRGALYIDYRPLDNSCRPLSRKLVFSMGEILTESAESAENMNFIRWPGMLTEVEIAPDLWDRPKRSFSHAGKAYILEGGAEPQLFCEGKLLGNLPENAEIPEYFSLDGGIALLGSCRGGKYLLTADREGQRTGFLRAEEINIDSYGQIHTFLHSAGHGIREKWRLGEGGLQLLSSEPTAPEYPQNPEESAIFAIEAARSGSMEEAEKLLSARLREQNLLKSIAERCDLCVKMKYFPQNARPAIGLLTLEGERLARVEPLFYRAVLSEEGRWQIDEFLMT